LGRKSLKSNIRNRLAIGLLAALEHNQVSGWCRWEKTSC
jgi:hypothetical protein